MNILTRFQGILEKNIRDHFNKYLYNISSAFDHPFNIDCYKQFVEDFDTFTSSLILDAYQELIRQLDDEFFQSSIRKQLYDAKDFQTKPLLTKFGWITFKRRRYKSKVDRSSFTYVDRLLGLVKYSRFDPFVISELCEESTTNSYAKAARNVSKMIGTKIKYDDNINKDMISRATTRNNVIKASQMMNVPSKDDLKAVEVLNIMADEKYVGSQFNDGQDHMIKAAVVFEDYKKEYKARIRLTGKKAFGSIENNLLSEVMNYIYYNYDTTKLKVINFMGDGALWIKAFAADSSFKYHPNIKINFGLDHFHLAQAIQQITTNKYKIHYNFLYRYVISNKKDYFIKICESLINLNKYREQQIREKMDYIINNWQAIQNSYHNIKFKCSMEAHISHIFADIFTSRPKAYSKKGLNALLNIRLLKINGYDLKKLYFISLKEKIQRTTEKQLITKVYAEKKKVINKYSVYFNHSLIDSNFNLKINTI